MLRKGDILLVISVFLIVALGYLGMRYFGPDSSEHHRILVIKQDSKVIRKIDLDTVEKPERIVVPGDYKNVILIEKGRAKVLESKCPDGICVKAGWLENSGDSAICLPNKTIVKIEGEKNKADTAAH